METYSGTPSRSNTHQPALTIDGIHQIKLRLLQATNETSLLARRFLQDQRYLPRRHQLPNWAFNLMMPPPMTTSGHPYGKYEAGPNLTAFYRTDGSFGFIVEIGFCKPPETENTKDLPPDAGGFLLFYIALLGISFNIRFQKSFHCSRS